MTMLPTTKYAKSADVHGIAVHTGARVASLAGAGEMLVSGTVKDLVAGSGITFEDRGAQVLKGIPGEWRLYAVASGELAWSAASIAVSLKNV